MSQFSKLAVEELIPNAQHHVSELLLNIGDLPFLGDRFRDQATRFRRIKLVEKKSEAVPLSTLVELHASPYNLTNRGMNDPARVEVRHQPLQRGVLLENQFQQPQLVSGRSGYFAARDFSRFK